MLTVVPDSGLLHNDQFWLGAAITVTFLLLGAMFVLPRGSYRSGAETPRALGRALQAGLRSGEIHVRYRPVLRLADGHHAAVEAVPTWLRPSQETVMGEDLRHLVDRAALDVGFDLHLIERCVPQLSSVLSLTDVDEPWLGVPVRESALRDPAFAAGVAASLAAWGSDGEGLALVLDIAPSTPEARGSAQRLQDLGIWFVLPVPTTASGTTDRQLFGVGLDPDLVAIACTSGAGTEQSWVDALRAVRAMGTPVLVTHVARPDDARIALRNGAAFGMGDAFGAPASLAELFGPVDMTLDDL